MIVHSLLRSGPRASTILTSTVAIAAATFSEASPDKSPCTCSSSIRPEHDKPNIQFRRLFSVNPNANSQQSTSTSLPSEEQQKSHRPLHNSVLLIPNVLSPAECKVLRGEADRLLDDESNGGGNYRRDRCCDEEDEDEDSSLRRVSVCDMSATAQSLAHKIIMERVLPIMQLQTPHLLCGLEGWDRADASFEWASNEPSVNRYTAGGQFEPHRDGYNLTIVLLLSKDGSFSGGGTEFFDSKRKSTGSGESDGAKSVLLKPSQGTALCFDGDITHAGSPVISGTRHLFVASFSIK